MENCYIVCFDYDEIGQFSSEAEAEEFMFNFAQSLLDTGRYNSDSTLSYYATFDHNNIICEFTMAEFEQGCLL